MFAYAPRPSRAEARVCKERHGRPARPQVPERAHTGVLEGAQLDRQVALNQLGEERDAVSGLRSPSEGWALLQGHPHRPTEATAWPVFTALREHTVSQHAARREAPEASGWRNGRLRTACVRVEVKTRSRI